MQAEVVPGRLVLPAPAKLNLLLRIIGRRPDGYHRLQTVFQFIDLCDELVLGVREDGHIRRTTDLPGVPPAQDLVVRAAALLQAHTGCGQGADIGLRKRIPMGGGLGGGSSDAATVLVGLNRLWRTGLAPDALAELGLALGADVPVFVRGHAAWAEEVGERLTPLDLPEPLYLVVHPGCEVSTGGVFSDPELTRNSAPITITDFLSGQVSNDCTTVVRRGYPAVAKALDWLQGYGHARLTGTGACVFVQVACETDGKEVLGRLPEDWAGFLVRGLNRSPLYDAGNE